MASLLYVFPHPDDESFGPAPVLARQRREGHEVHLLTLTHGEATKERHKHGYSKEEMGRQRRKEMEEVAEALDLTSLTVLGFPDGEMDELDPLDLEAAIERHVREVEPDVLVTYATHGISGHLDHLVGHAAVKRVFAAMRDRDEGPRRLAFFTLPESEAEGRPEHLRASPLETIDVVETFAEEDLERGRAALACYVTYQDVVEKQQPLEQVREGVSFQLFQESFDPVLGSLTESLPERPVQRGGESEGS